MADSVIPELVSRGRIKAAEVLAVVDRRAFVPKSSWAKIDVDHATFIAPTHTYADSIMHVATLIEALDIKRGNSVLDIGCGVGHLTAIAAYLVGKTGYAIGIDVNPAVIKYAQECLTRLDVKLENVAYFPMNVYFMDKKIKFDRIVVGLACPSTHVRSIISQLNVSGVLVTPMPDGKLYQIRRINDDEWTKEIIGSHKVPTMQMPQTTEDMVKGAAGADAALDTMKKWIAARRTLSNSQYNSSLSSTGSSGSAAAPVSTDAQLTPIPLQTSDSSVTSISQSTSATPGSSMQLTLSAGSTPVPSLASLNLSGSGGIQSSGGKGAVQYYCDKCGTRIPSGGIRWHCDDCGDLDLCQSCFNAGPPYPEPHDYFLHSNLVAFSTGRDPTALDAKELCQLQCASCSRYIVGLRWHCAICTRYDLCAACHSNSPSQADSFRRRRTAAQAQHTLDHPMVPYQEPGQRRLSLSSGSMRVPLVSSQTLPSPNASRQPKSTISPSSSQSQIDQSSLRSLVNQSANELLERLKLYDVHGVSPFSSPIAPVPAAPIAQTTTLSAPGKPMFNASLYAGGSVSRVSVPARMLPATSSVTKNLLSGSSEDEKEDAEHLHKSMHIQREPDDRAAKVPTRFKSSHDATSDRILPTALSSNASGTVTYFGDEVGPLQGAEHAPALPLSHTSFIQTSGSQSAISPLVPSAVGVDVPIIKWSELEIGELLGSGAFGTVHAGRWRGAPVAIKRLHVVPDNPLEFMHEAAMMRKMSHHPNIIRLFGICDDPANFAIISQLCSNGSLHDILTKRPPGDVPWHRIVGIARDAAAGAYHLHCENLIHRDLACRNILVTENWTGVISDFGLSRVLENQNKSHRTATMSAVRWAAPECLKDEKYSSKSDVWSFGMCLVEILTRGPPFPNLSYAEILRAVYTDRTLPIDLPSESDRVLQDLVLNCCKQDPDERIDFQDIYAILDRHYKSLVAVSTK